MFLVYCNCYFLGNVLWDYSGMVPPELIGNKSHTDIYLDVFNLW